jgi:hypothetical protein
MFYNSDKYVLLIFVREMKNDHGAEHRLIFLVYQNVVL